MGAVEEISWSESTVYGLSHKNILGTFWLTRSSAAREMGSRLCTLVLWSMDGLGFNIRSILTQAIIELGQRTLVKNNPVMFAPSGWMLATSNANPRAQDDAIPVNTSSSYLYLGLVPISHHQSQWPARAFPFSQESVDNHSRSLKSTSLVKFINLLRNFSFPSQKFSKRKKYPCTIAARRAPPGLMFMTTKILMQHP